MPEVIRGRGSRDEDEVRTPAPLRTGNAPAWPRALLALRAVRFGRLAVERAVELLADRVFLPGRLYTTSATWPRRDLRNGSTTSPRGRGRSGSSPGCIGTRRPPARASQPWPSSIPQGWTTMTAVRSARRWLGISMIPRALYENRQARTSRSAPGRQPGRAPRSGPSRGSARRTGVVGQDRLRGPRSA